MRRAFFSNFFGCANLKIHSPFTSWIIVVFYFENVIVNLKPKIKKSSRFKKLFSSILKIDALTSLSLRTSFLFSRKHRQRWRWNYIWRNFHFMLFIFRSSKIPSSSNVEWLLTTATTRMSLSLSLCLDEKSTFSNFETFSFFLEKK